MIGDVEKTFNVELRFHRRRYGGKTFTWGYCNGNSMGDPYPGVNWSREALCTQIRLMKKRGEI
jgi:hypothetical protein